MTANEIVDNYINGNISDFITGVRSIRKSKLLYVVVGLSEYLSVKNDYKNETYSDNGYYEAIKIVQNAI